MISADNFSGITPPNGIYEWSPLLEKAGWSITYWKLRLSLLQVGNPNSAWLEQFQTGLDVEDIRTTEKVYLCKKYS